MRKRLYEFLINLLEGVVDQHGSRIIKHIDLWNMNVEYAEIDGIFATPAVFIEFHEVKYESFNGPAGTLQKGDINFSLHIVTQSIATSDAGSSTQQIALEFFDIIDAIHAHLNQKSNPGIGSLRRILSQTNHNHGQLLESIETYTTMLKDLSARIN